MAIQSIAKRDNPPVIGTIRLGAKVKTASGGERPDNTSYFVLHDAPQVIPVYGDMPGEIDICFPSDDLDAAVPTWLKWWRPGAKGADGKAISGILRCRGDGPDENGKPGTALYYDKTDPKTGEVPTRPCLGERCPDWNDARGNRQCKPNMQIYAFLPKVSPYGVFKISTTSWTTIKSLYDQLTWLKKLNHDKIRGIPFKLAKVQKSWKTYDKNGNEQKRTQWVVVIKPLEDQKEIDAMRHSVNLLSQAPVTWSAPPELSEVPIEDVPYIEAGDASEKLSLAEQVAADPEVQAGFAALSAALGEPISLQDQLIKIRQKEKEPDVKKAVLDGIARGIATLEARNKKAQRVEPAAPPPVEVPVEAQAAPSEGLF